MVTSKREEVEYLSKKILLKKVYRLKKRLSAVKLYNTSLKSSNRELALTVQQLKDNRREAEKKLRCMNTELCHAIGVKNTFQESFKKLSGIMPELTSVLHGTSSIVSKVYSAITETTFRANDNLNLSGYEMMANYCESMRQTSESANDMLQRIQGLEMRNATNNPGRNNEDVPTPNTLIPSPVRSCSGSNAGSFASAPSDRARTGTNIAENISFNPPVHPEYYRVPLLRILSPVEEQSSQLTENIQEHTNIEESSRNDEDNIPDHESIQTEVELINEKRVKLEVNIADDEYSQCSDFRDEGEQKVTPQEMEQIGESISCNQSLFEDTIQPYPSEKMLRDAGPCGSLSIDIKEPDDFSNGILDMSTLPYPSSDNDLPIIGNTFMEGIEEETVQNTSPGQSIAITVSSPPSSLYNFENVFPRKKRVAALPVDDTLVITEVVSLAHSNITEDYILPEGEELSSMLGPSSSSRRISIQSSGRKSQEEPGDIPSKNESPRTKSSLTRSQTPSAPSPSRLTRSQSPLTRSKTPLAISHSTLVRMESPSPRMSSRPSARMQYPSARMKSLSASMKSPSARMQSPTARMESPSTKMQSPSARMKSPPARMESPSTKMQSPSARMESPSTKMQSPSARMKSPPARMESPTDRMESPSARMKSPPGRMQSPSARMKSPPARVRSPSARMRTPSAWMKSPSPKMRSPSSARKTQSPFVSTTTPTTNNSGLFGEEKRMSRKRESSKSHSSLISLSTPLRKKNCTSDSTPPSGKKSTEKKTPVGGTRCSPRLVEIAPSSGRLSTEKKIPVSGTRWSPRLVGRGRKTRKIIKSYKEPCLNTKLRR